MLSRIADAAPHPVTIMSHDRHIVCKSMRSNAALPTFVKPEPEAFERTHENRR
jgi:hypothetical protein